MSSSTVRIKYTEGAAAVTIDGLGRVERGVGVDAPPKLAERLLEQGWERDTGPASTSNVQSSTKATAETAKGSE